MHKLIFAPRFSVIHVVVLSGLALLAWNTRQHFFEPQAAAVTEPARPVVATVGVPPIRHITEHEYEVPRSLLEQGVGSMDPVARVVPAFKDGAFSGFKLFSLRPGTVLTNLGFENGDLITHVNGVALTTPEQVLALYNQRLSHFDVDFDRKGTSVSKHYAVVE